MATKLWGQRVEYLEIVRPILASSS